MHQITENLKTITEYYRTANVGDNPAYDFVALVIIVLSVIAVWVIFGKK